jgi:hypothetical protein
MSDRCTSARRRAGGARIVVALLVAAGGLPFPAVAQQQMPDPSQMAGRPLPAPELETGVVSVRVVRERLGNNLANQPVALKTPDRTLTATTDEQGRAQFTGIAPNTVVTAETVVDGETLTSQSFPVPAQSGVRVALIAGLAAAVARERAAAEEGARQPARSGIVVLGGESRIIVEFQDDNLQVFYLLDFVNAARTPIDTGGPLVLELPASATGASTLQGSSSLAMLQGNRLRVTGPFPPGTTSVQVGFRLPYRGNSVTLTQVWPTPFEQLFVAAEKVGNLAMSSPQFEQQREASASGTPFLMATGGRINPGQPLTLTLSGLPYHSTLMRDVGVATGILILLAGLWAGVRATPARTGHATELRRRQDKLFADLLSLEEQRRRGRIDNERYVTRRETLMGQLERVMGELDRDPTGGAATAAS